MKFLLAAWLSIMLPAGIGLAATTDLYVGEVTVANQSPAERLRAMPAALENVLQKLSGLRSFEDHPLVEPALGRATSIVVSFYYRNTETTLSDGTQLKQLQLLARFSESEVNEMMRALRLPIWRSERHPAELWVVVDDGLDRRILPLELNYIWDSMGDVARLRGMPISWPAPDADGNFPVDSQLLWGGYTEDLMTDSRRHSVLVAAARREGAEWSVRFNLGQTEQNWSWRDRDIDLQKVLIAGLQQSIDLIASADTIAAADQGTWLHEVTVSGIGNPMEYARCLAYLEGLSVVNRATVASARAGLVRFRLELNALPQYLDEALAQGTLLEIGQPGGNSYVLAE